MLRVFLFALGPKMARVGDEGAQHGREASDEEVTLLRGAARDPFDVSERTQRIIPTKIDRRALPFKKSRERRLIASNPDPSQTGEMRPVREPVLPFGDASGDIPPDPPTLVRQPSPQRASEPPQLDAPQFDAPQSDPLDFEHESPAPTPAPAPDLPATDLAASVWSREPVLDPRDLPSALAPTSAAPMQAVAKGGLDATSVVVLAACALVVVVCAVVVLL
jgi:hypothetical protein